MSENPIVYVLRAVNMSDFNESDIVIVGYSRESAAQQLGNILKDRWENHLNVDDKEFYQTLENYQEAWNEQYDWTRIV